MGFIYNNDLTSIVNRINNIRKKHGLPTVPVQVDQTMPRANDMNNIVNSMKGLTNSKYIQTVNANPVTAGEIMKQSYLTETQQELVRLENICTHDASYYVSDYRSDYRSDYKSNNSSYKGSDDSSYNSGYDGSDNSSYDSSNKSSYNSGYNGGYYAGGYNANGSYNSSDRSSYDNSYHGNYDSTGYNMNNDSSYHWNYDSTYKRNY